MIEQTQHWGEVVQLQSGLFVAAAATHFRLYRPSLFEHPILSQTVPTSGIAVLTRQVLAGALYAGMGDKRTLAKAACQRDVKNSILLRHIFSLAASYQTTSVTPPVMRQAAEALEARGQKTAAEHCRKVAVEEAGHDTLALMDLTALGLPAQQLVERLRPEKSLALADLFRSMAVSQEPITTLGYAYALERVALFTTSATIEAVETAMPPGVNATRCLRVHSAVGSDSGHVTESIDLIASLPPKDRVSVAQAAFATARLMFSELDGYPGDDGMRTLLGELGWIGAQG